MEVGRTAKWSGLGGGLVVSLLLHVLILAALLISFEVEKSKPEAEMVPVTLVPAPEEPAPPQPEPEPEQAPESEPEPEAAPEPPAEAPTDTQEAGAVEAAPIAALRPVFRFGHKDTGPEKALDGNSAEKPSEPEKPAPERVEDKEPVEDKAPVEDRQPEEDQGEERPNLAMPEIALPSSELAGDNPGALADAAAETVLAPEEKEPAEKLPEAAKPDNLDRAKTLFSQQVSGDPVAMTAMGKLPRAIRASELCTTEMREQLRHSDAGYSLELLPSYKLASGNVLAVTNAAFRANGTWYELSFRCSLDDDAMQVMDFAFKVGDIIPKSQWKARGFPAF